MRVGFKAFQSTRPARGATVAVADAVDGFFISIHAPREGRDLQGDVVLLNEFLFQSTRPARGATTQSAANLTSIEISIHAPREGRDWFQQVIPEMLEISIHAPREGRDNLAFCLQISH